MLKLKYVFVLLASVLIVIVITPNNTSASLLPSVTTTVPFYNSNETAIYTAMLYNDSSSPKNVTIHIYIRYWGESVENTLYYNTHIINGNDYLTISDVFTIPSRSVSFHQTNPSRWLWIYYSVTDSSGTTTVSREVYVDYNWTIARKQESTNTCGVASVQMMVYHIRNILHSQSSIGYSQYMYQYREKVNNRISGYTLPGSPYT